ncbi:hypothetical protein CPB85DRAFT_1429764 [Mucidula mucida]|nr:hypothetical protein CPB85DRAFT_1429764 [Mucidula mucida]
MPSNPFKDLPPRKNTRIGDGYLKDATDETKQNSDQWDDQALADLRDLYTEAKAISDVLHERLDDSAGMAPLTTVNKGLNYRQIAYEVQGRAEHLTTTTTQRPLAPHGSATAEWQELTSKERLKVLNEDADFMTARPPDKQSIRTRATDGDSSQGDHDDSESFVIIEGLPASAISMSRKHQASAAPAHLPSDPPSQPTAHPNSSRDEARLHEKRLVRKTEAGLFYDGPSATPNMQQRGDFSTSHLTSFQSAPQITRAPAYALQMAPSQHSVPTSNSFGTRPNDQRLPPQGAPLHHAPTYASQMPPSHRSVPDTYNPAAVAPLSAQESTSQDASLQRSPTYASHVRSLQRAPTYASQLPLSHQSIPQGLSSVDTSLEHSPTYASQAPSSRRFVAGPTSSQAYTLQAPASQRYGPTSFPVTNTTVANRKLA